MTYIGRHSTNNLNDGYLGSGTILKKAIKKYGKDNFKLIILDYYNSFEELVSEEEYIITKDYCKRSDNYNIVVGGMNPIMYGEDNHMYGRKKSELELEKIRESSKKYYTPLIIYNVEYLSIDEAVKKLSLYKHDILRNCYVKPNDFKFKNFSDYDKYSKKYNVGYKVSCEVVINGVKYNSIKQASIFLNIHETTVIKRCLRLDNYNFSKKEDYEKYYNKYIKINLNKAVKVDEIIYNNKMICARTLGIRESTVITRCLSDNFSNWNFINDEYKQSLINKRIIKAKKRKIRNRVCKSTLF